MTTNRASISSTVPAFPTAGMGGTEKTSLAALPSVNGVTVPHSQTARLRLSTVFQPAAA